MLRRRRKPNEEIADRSLKHVAWRFLNSRLWCDHVESLELRLEIEGVMCIYLANFVPAEDGLEVDLVWVILGDLPPGLVFDDGTGTVKEILAIHVEKMREYSDAVDRGESDLSRCMPIMYRNATGEMEPSRELAGHVRDKADAIENVILFSLD